MMERLLKISVLALILTACAEPPGFKASDYTYTRLDQVGDLSGQEPQKQKPIVLKPGSVVRASKKIDFALVDSDWKQKNKNEVMFKANVTVAGKSYKNVEFKGTKKDSTVLLVPTNQELSENLRAQLVCTSDGNTCDEFFIDVLYKENDVIYQDQVDGTLPIHKKPETAQKDSKAADAKKPGANTQNPTPSKDDKNQKSPAPKKPAPEKKKDVIADGVEGADVETVQYVGISDEEARQIFKIPDPEVKEKKEPEPKKSAPVPPPPQQPSTPKNDGAKNEDAPKKAPSQPDSKNPSKSQDDQAPTKEDRSSAFERLRVKNQVIGLPTAGRLRNGTNFLQVSSLPGMFFFIANPNVGVKDYFGAFDLAVLMKKLGEALQTMMPGRKLAITAISRWGGGRLDPHEGHQNGTDIDVRYLTNNEMIPAQVITRGRANSNLLVSQQWKLVKKAFQTNMVEVFFMDSAIKKAMCEEARRVQDYKNGDNDSEGAEMLRRIQTWPGHDTHFHIRIRCSSDNPSCKPAPIKATQVGC